MTRLGPMFALIAMTGCLITDPVQFNPNPPVSPPLIIDEAGTTTPRLTDFITVLAPGTTRGTVMFSVPVDDANVNDRLQYEFFVDQPRECGVGGVACTPPSVGPFDLLVTRERRRIVNESLSFDPGCHRVELWVSTRFDRSANTDYHTPVSAGDVDFTTWWVFVHRNPGDPGNPAFDPTLCPVIQSH